MHRDLRQFYDICGNRHTWAHEGGPGIEVSTIYPALGCDLDDLRRGRMSILAYGL